MGDFPFYISKLYGQREEVKEDDHQGNKGEGVWLCIYPYKGKLLCVSPDNSGETSPLAIHSIRPGCVSMQGAGPSIEVHDTLAPLYLVLIMVTQVNLTHHILSTLKNTKA